MQKLGAWLTNSLVPSYLLVIGGGIGWLIGLSVSPVVSIVITSITGAAAAIIAALSGLQDKRDDVKEVNRLVTPVLRWNVDPLPLMILVLGILLGSIFGIKARNEGWLGTDLSIEVEKWTNAGLLNAGFTKEEMVRRLFESRYYTNTRTLGTEIVQNKSLDLGTVLFDSSSSECQTLITAAKMADDAVLKNALASSTISQLWMLPVIITDTATLKNVVEQVLCADGQ